MLHPTFLATPARGVPVLLLKHLASDADTHEPTIRPAAKEGFTPIEKAGAADVLDAQMRTASFLDALGVPDDDDVVRSAHGEAARSAFIALANGSPDPRTKDALLKLHTPPAVRHLTGLLTAYDWAYIEQAKELRGYAVAKIMEETVHPDAKIRLRALELLGKVSEVGLFTDKVEVKSKREDTDGELNAKLLDKMRSMGLVTDATEIENPPAEDAVMTPAEPDQDAKPTPEAQ